MRQPLLNAGVFNGWLWSARTPYKPHLSTPEFQKHFTTTQFSKLFGYFGVFQSDHMVVSNDLRIVAISTYGRLVYGVCSSHYYCKPFFIRRHPAHPVSALILHPREIQALWLQNDTGSYAVPGRQLDSSAMPCRCAGI